MARLIGVRGSLRPRVLALIPLLLTGCLGGDPEETPASEVADSLASIQPLQGDTTPLALGLPDPETGPPEIVLGDSLGLTLTQDVQADSFPTAMEELANRVGRLEEENDSLRIALRTLIPLLSAGNRGDSVSEPASGSQEDLLSVEREQVRNWGLRTIIALFILVLTGLVVGVSAWVLERLAERNAKRRLILKRMIPVLRIMLWGMATFLVLRVAYGIDGQEFVAAAAAVGVAVGFAAQDILKNILGGLIVLFDQPFQVGDKISIGGTYGEVVSIGLRSTRITTPDDSLVTVPNHQVVGGQVSNANSGELNCQVVTDLYLPGWVDESEAKKIAFDAAVSSKYVYLNKPIVVLVRDKFQDTFLTHIKVKAYVLDPRYEFLLMSDVTERARAGFRKAGLLGPMHGVRAYVDLDRFPEVVKTDVDEEKDGA